MTKHQIIDVNGVPISSRNRKRGSMTAGYLRGDGVGTLPMRRATLRDHREDIRAAWPRVAALTIDVLQNNGRLAGAIDQVLADTVGAELVITPNPDFTGLRGWTKKRREEWIALVKKRYNRWANDPIECDLRGKQTIGQMTDAAVRWSIGYGEGTGLVAYLTPDERIRRGSESGTKICMIQPHRLVQETREFENLYQGILHDADGLPIAYRFKERVKGVEGASNYPARDSDGRRLIIHVMDGEPGDVRGVGKFAPALKTWLQHDQLRDATLAQQLIQTIFAATLKSENLDGDALEGLLTANDVNGVSDLIANMVGYQNAKFQAAQENGVDFSTHGRINSLPVGDSLEFHTPGNTKDTFIPLANNQLREIARCIGVTPSSFTMDYGEATYSSTKMEYSSIWPVVIRRRKRIAKPVPQIAYENWLDEEIGEGRIPFFGGYEAFRANRKNISAIQAHGPPKPVADDLKAGKAQSERLYNSTSSLEIECAENGLDVEEVLARRSAELETINSLGLPNPFERNPGAGLAVEALPEDQDD